MKSRSSALSYANPFLRWGTLGVKAVRTGLDVFDAGARLAHRALAPVHSTATANARRLAQKRR